MKKNLVYLMVLLTCVACNNGDKSVDNYNSKKETWALEPQVKTKAATVEKKSSGFKWDAPKSWVVTQGSSMRIGSFSLPGKTKSEEADLSVITLAGKAGGYVANINRWRGQLGLDSLQADQINKSVKIIKSTLGEVKFLYLKNEKSGKGILSAVYEGASKVLFIKARGNSSVLNLHEANFKKFIGSFDVK